MPCDFDTLFDSVAEPLIAAFFGSGVEYTFRDGHSVTDTEAIIDFIESGYEVDGGIRSAQDQDSGNHTGIETEDKRAFGLHKAIIGESQPEMGATLRVVDEGDNADVWTVMRVSGSDSAMWYLACERVPVHERSRKGFRRRA